MNDIIKLLPDSVANQIAAGEVIQRPASVIKELVENSVDAGATDIQIILKDAGRTLIQVVDNGTGMSETDARMAFERHATSKIEQAADLYSLHSMGFRGEALASIAAVAQIELRTMRAGDSVGTRIVIGGSQVEAQEPVATNVGTSIMVKNLFYTVPARRKFLKKDSVELSAIVREFERLALVNPDLNFTMWHNDQMIHQISKSSMKKRICDLFGKNLDRQLLPVATDTSMVRLNGFISLPANARKRNALQYLLVNGRNMRHPGFHKAILECYKELIPQDSQPNYFIAFTVEPDRIDVNIHPTKNEIKFEDEFGIIQILKAAVKETLGKFNAMPGIEFDVDDSPEIPVFSPNASGNHDLDLDTSYNPFAPQPDSAVESRPSAMSATGTRSGAGRNAMAEIASAAMAPHDWDKLYEEFERNLNSGVDSLAFGGESAMGNPKPAAPQKQEDTPKETTQQSESHTIGLMPSATPERSAISALRISGGYIASPCRSGVMLIDQNRAHIRILYDGMIESIRRQSVSIQKILFPEVIELSVARSVLLESIQDEMTKLGFELSPLGDNAWSIVGVPSNLGNNNAADVIAAILDEAQSGEIHSEADNLSGRLALGMARSMAIKHSTRLSDEEASNMLSELLQLPAPNYTPDGLKIIAILDTQEIASLLSR